MTAFLARRSRQSELLDDASISYEEFAETLDQLETLNRIVGAYRPTIAAIGRFARTHRTRGSGALRVLDIGSGGGDMLRNIHGWAGRNGVDVELTGVDLSPWSARAAAERTPPAMRIRYHTADVFAFDGAAGHHVIINSLFTHHLSDDGVVGVLKWMAERVRYGFFVNDLHRNPVPYQLIKTFVTLLPFNRLIRNDAPLSVARAFTRGDWSEYARLAGLDKNRLNVAWHWPFRWGVRYDV